MTPATRTNVSRRHFLAGLCAAALPVVAWTPARARTLEQIRATRGPLRVATEGQFAPFNFFQGTRLTGFEVELAEAVVSRMGLVPEWKAVGFDALLTGLAQDRWDLVIASHGITPERARAVTFANPHYCGGGVVVSRDPAIHSARDLQGRVVSVQTGTTYIEHVRALGGLKAIKNFPQDTDARSALITGRVDAWVTDRFAALAAVRMNPQAGLLVGDSLFVERIAAAVALGNQSLADGWNAALARTFADGTYATLSKKYFGEDIRCK